MLFGADMSLQPRARALAVTPSKDIGKGEKHLVPPMHVVVVCLLLPADTDLGHSSTIMLSDIVPKP
jgi:hypothetical protein